MITDVVVGVTIGLAVFGEGAASVGIGLPDGGMITDVVVGVTTTLVLESGGGLGKIYVPL